MEELEVALVGCGFVADGHLRAWRRLNHAKVIAVCDLNAQLAKDTANVWEIPSYYASFSEMIRKEEANVVDICTPPSTHADLAVSSMETGANVLIEKPMTMTVSDAEKIVSCQKNSGVKVGVVHNWLFESSILEARRLVDRGLLGEVLSVEVETLNTPDDSMAANEHHWCHRLPGGRFSEMLAHPIYLARHFLGGEVATSDVRVSKLGSYPWMKSDELCAISHVGRKLVRFYSSFNASRDSICVNLYGREGIAKVEIVNSILTFLPRKKTERFSKGYDSLKQAWQIVGRTGKNVMKVLSKSWMSGPEMYIKLFSESLIGGYEPPVSAIDGLAVIKSLEEMCIKILEREKDQS